MISTTSKWVENCVGEVGGELCRENCVGEASFTAIENSANENEDRRRHLVNQKQKKKILEAGTSFAEVWNDVACSIKLKKKLIRTLLKEIVVNLDDNTDELHFLMHWHGGVHTEVSMQKPLSAVKKYRTSQ